MTPVLGGGRKNFWQKDGGQVHGAWLKTSAKMCNAQPNAMRPGGLTQMRGEREWAGKLWAERWGVACWLEQADGAWCGAAGVGRVADCSLLAVVVC